MTMQEAIASLAQGRHLSVEQASEVMRLMMTGEATHAQMAALLTALRINGESTDEITGFARTMREFATPVRVSRRPVVDTCGTGGDHSRTFNISTAAAFVAAGAGVAVAKHGNRSATSRCGSADVLEALGVNIAASPECVARCIDAIGIGFLFARSLHGAMKHVAPVRAELGIRTVFNLLGPLTNPAGADAQLMGLYDAGRIESIAQVLLQLGSRHVFVVAGKDGLDELTLSGPSLVAEGRDGHVMCYELDPARFGMHYVDKAVLKGGDAAENAMILRRVLEGERGPRRDVVLLNTAPAIVAGQAAHTLEEAIVRAEQSIDSGAALNKLEELIRLTHDS